MVEGHERRVGAAFPEPGAGQHPGPGRLAEAAPLSLGERTAFGIRPDRPARDLADLATGPASVPEAGGEGRVPPGLPGDVRVEANEPRLPQEVDPFLAAEPKEFREDPRCTPSERAIRVVDADPDRPAPRGRFPTALVPAS